MRLRRLLGVVQNFAGIGSDQSDFDGLLRDRPSAPPTNLELRPFRQLRQLGDIGGDAPASSRVSKC